MLNLYTETPFQASPPSPESRLYFQIPRRNGSYNKSKFSGSNRGGMISVAKDEPSHARQSLATQSSIHFRQSNTYPRTFLWRVTSDDRILEVQCADLARGGSDIKEAYLTLHFEFQDPLITRGVSVADSESAEEVHAFVCTDKNELFDLRLHTDFFREAKAIDRDLGQWCKPIETSALSIESPHLLYASTPLELFISFNSGRLLSLKRRSKEEHWTQENYDDKTWGASLRGIVSRRGLPSIEFGHAHLAPTTVHAMCAPSDGIHLHTVCMNHTLRVWHLPTGKLVATKDLLDIARDPNERMQLNPAEPGFLQLIKLPLHRNPILVTYSPYEGGQFKFWDLKGGLTDALVIEDKYPGVKLSPPDPDPSGNTIWSLTGFQINPGDDFKPAQLWVLWRNNNYHQLYSMHFDFSELQEAWDTNWVTCVSTTFKKAGPPDFVRSDARDITSNWIEYLLFPGRYAASVLETALSILQDAISVKESSTNRNKPLVERLCTFVASNAALRKSEHDDLDYDRFMADIDYQWRNLWRIVENVNDGRKAPIALAFDLFADMAWITMADQCCAIRECSKIELLRCNEPAEVDSISTAAGCWPHRKVTTDDGEPFHRIACFIAAARSFRNAFSAELASDFTSMIEDELFTQSELSSPERVVELYAKLNFTQAVSNEMYDELEKDLEPVSGLTGLNNELFFAVLDILSINGKRPDSALRSTLFGSLVISAGLLEDIEAMRELLYDLLALAIFVEGEFSEDEARPVTSFEAAELIEQILPLLREQEKNFWLATHHRMVPLDFSGPGPASSSRVELNQTIETSRRVSILEDTLSRSVKPQPPVDRPLMYLVTDLLAEIQDWISGKNVIKTEDGIVYLQCDLLAHGEVELATEFLRFQPTTSWSTYIKGRLRLARGEFPEAALCFRKAAYALACGRALGNLMEMSAGLLSLVEAESFNNGLSRYYQHVFTLFEIEKVFVQTAEFATLALQTITAGQKGTAAGLRSEVLSRLFTAELKCQHFGSAYGALVQFSDHALQKSSAVALVNAIFSSKLSLSGCMGAMKTLEKLPLRLNPQLAQYIDLHLSTMAKRQTTISAISGQWTDNSNIDYLQVWYALRVKQNDYRGALIVLFDRLRLVQRSGKARNDPQATALRHALLALINLMTCVAPEEAYVLADTNDSQKTVGVMPGQRDTSEENGNAWRKRRRIIVTLADLRKQYQQVLDRCSRIERGDFDFDFDLESGSDDDEQMEE